MKEAEDMYLRALAGREKAWGPEHTSTLRTVNNLGALYKDQGKMKEAEDMYLRALAGREKAWGPEHTSTLRTVNNLGALYKDRVSRRHRRRFESARHFIPQTAPRLVPQDKEESCTCGHWQDTKRPGALSISRP